MIAAPTSLHPQQRRIGVAVLALSLLLSGFCGILAELSLFNLAETLLGGTNENLTYTMGFMMFAMGMGAALSAHGWFRDVGVGHLIAVELVISFLAMISVVGIYTAAGHWPGTAAVLIWAYGPLLGLAIGLEIPLVLRLNEALGLGLRPNAALALAPDYLGALAAFVLFSFWLLPALGLARTAWLGGVLNLAVAALVLGVFRGHLQRPLAVSLAFGLTLLAALALGVRMEPLMAAAEQRHYRDGIVVSRETPYQRIVVTDRAVPGNAAYHAPQLRGGHRVVAESGPAALVERKAPHPGLCEEDVRLFLNGGLQFSTCDAHRYHEMLVHPAVVVAGVTEAPFRALVLGGGDGLAVRELLKYPQARIDLVELDAEVLALFRDDPRFAELSGAALRSPRVQVHVADAYRFLRESAGRYEVVVLDFPDPHQSATARLYSVQLYRFAARALAPTGVLVTQSFSPLYHQPAFLVVRKTLAAAGYRVVSLQVPMLAFEHWGFHLATRHLAPAAMEARLDAFRTPVPTRYLNRPAVQAARRWDKEAWSGAAALPVNDQFTLPLLRIYNRGFPAP